jgi:hypothetical protein
VCRAAEPQRFTVRRIIGAGELWVTEYVQSYDGRLSYTVSIMEFLNAKVARETQYFGGRASGRMTARSRKPIGVAASQEAMIRS